MLEIYNTLKRDKEKFVSRKENRINLFVCGPTVYDDAHIGHGRTYISFDLIKSYLEFVGYSVFYIENITDIDDKIIMRSKERNVLPEILASFYEKRFREDMGRLNVNGVNLFARATEHLAEIESQIDRLIEKGFAYESDDGVYFEVSKFSDYGKLSNQDITKLDNHRLDFNEHKKTANDFALWKKTEIEPYYPSKYGNGRPGWHIEDTAITETYFGSQYDIHGGGLDLIFPHHEAEIAQMEAISGKVPLVKYWMHTGFLNVDGVKMSKSLGNFVTIRELLEDWEPMVFRLFVLSTHYRSPIDFSEKSLNQASKNLGRLKNTVKKLLEFRSFLKELDVEDLSSFPLSPEENFGLTSCYNNDLGLDLLIELHNIEEKFFKSMNDDFNTPRALAAILNFTKSINGFIDEQFENLKDVDGKKIPYNDFKVIFEFSCQSLRFFRDFEKIFKLGLFIKDDEVSSDISKDTIDLLLEIREKLRLDKNYELSDYIRDKMNELGINIEDK
ncbi:MAG: cysteine--tRNA ligase [Methanobrevibacter sp.]|jgi:cysteinyl-tRNA synthetase|nr:cysteine--tRNA ligase [Candidatus Methanoflexus mossambicus]